MRQSVRLKDSETSLKLKDEQFISTVATEAEDDEEVLNFEEEVFDYKIMISSPKNSKNLKKRGRPRKLAPKLEEVDYKVIEEVVDLTPNEFIPRKRGRPRKNPAKLGETESQASNENGSKPSILYNGPEKSTTKKKINRNGPYIPPLELINTNLLSSREEWKSFFEEENPKIKRKNRRYKTVMFPSNENEDFNVNLVVMSSFQSINQKLLKKPLELSVNNNRISLLNDSLIVEGKLSNFNVGNPIISINFCKCTNCKRGSDKILIYAVSPKIISIMSTEISKKDGIKSMREVGQILSPEAESFKSVCVVESVLSASTENSIYFLNCETLHQEGIQIILEKGIQIIAESSNLISCHSWTGKNIAVGTISGRVHVFNGLLNEIYQISVKSDSMICSLDWRDDFTILIGGNFPKIFSIDLRDPFIIATEVSALGKKTSFSCNLFIVIFFCFVATLPKVVWSLSLNSILFSDSENHGRRLEKSEESGSHFHHPLGTFDSMVNDMKTSPSHNIIATAGASGSIHLAWMSDEPGQAVEYEKCIYTMKLTENGVFELNLNSEYVPFQAYDVIKLYPSIQSCTTVDWCPNEKFPGLLAGGYRNGLIVLIATDRFFI
jgi:hypothetical protein